MSSAAASRSVGLLDCLIRGIELTAASFLATVALITFVSVLLRYFVSWTIPDAYDVGALLLGVLIFWGMAGAGYRGDHITVDLIYGLCPRPVQWAIDCLASLITLGAMAAFAWMMGEKVLSTRADGVLTFDLRLPVWMFYLIAWLGLAAAALLIAVRIGRLVRHPGPPESPPGIAEHRLE